jgi:hypothetical protein
MKMMPLNKYFRKKQFGQILVRAAPGAGAVFFSSKP